MNRVKIKLEKSELQKKFEELNLVEPDNDFKKFMKMNEEIDSFSFEEKSEETILLDNRTSANQITDLCPLGTTF